MNINQLRMDSDKEQKGVWFDYIGDIKLKIARTGNPNYRAAMTELNAGDLDVLQIGDTQSKQLDLVQMKIASKALLVGWQNLTGDDNVEIPYSEEKAFELLSDPELGHLYDFVIVSSSNLERFLQDKEQQESGN